MNLKIELETIKKVDGVEIKKKIHFDVAAINIGDWDLDRASKMASPKTCKIFLSSTPFEAFQINMPKHELVNKLKDTGSVQFL